MSDLRRLSTRNDLGAALLRSAKEDRVPEGSLARAVSAAVLASAAATAPAAGTSVLHRLGVAAKTPVAKLTYLMVSALLAGGAIAINVASPGASGGSADTAAVTRPRSVVAVPVTAVPEVRSSESSDVPNLRLEDLPQASASAPASAAPTSVAIVTTASAVPATDATVASPAALDASLAEEVQALDGVRSALRGGDATGALTKLAAYDAKFPKKQLGREAAVLRARAEQLREQPKPAAP